MTASRRGGQEDGAAGESGAGMAAVDDRVLDFARASGDWFWEIDAEGRFTFVSDQMFETIGLRPEACIGKTRLEMQAGRAHEPTWKAYDDLLKARKPFRDFTFKHIRADGTVIPIGISGVPVFHGRDFVGFRGTGRALPQSEMFERLVRNVVGVTSLGVGREFLNLIAVALCRELDIDHVYISRLSPDRRSAETIVAVVDGKRVPNITYPLSGGPCETVTRTTALCVYPRAVADVFPDDAFLVEQGIEGYIGVPLHGADGRCLGLMVAMSRAPLVLESLHRLVFEFFAGRVAAELDRALTEEQLRNKEVLLEAIIDALPEGLTVKDTDHRYLMVNRVFAGRYGRQAEDVLGRTSAEAFPEWGDALQDQKGQENDAVDSDRLLIRPQKRRFADGKDHFLEIRKFPIRASDGRLLAIGTLTLDETERVTRQAEAADRERILKSYHQALDRIVGSEAMASNSAEDAFALLTQVAAETLGVERVSVWSAGPEDADIRCLDLYRLSTGGHEREATLDRGTYPSYFEAFQRGEVIDAEDAPNDPRTRELAADYIPDNGIASLLDVAIHVGGELRGIFCLEHVGARRRWTLEEQSLARSLASLASLIMVRREQEESEEERRRLERRFVEVVNALPSSLSLKDRDQRYVFVNKLYEQNYGISGASVLGKTIRETGLNNEEILASIEAEDTAVLEEGRSFTKETVRIRGDGSECAALVSKFPLFGADGKVEMVATLWTDITAQKTTQRSLEEAEAQLRAITDNVPIMLAQKGLDGRFKFCNASYADWHRTTPTDIIGKTSHDMVSPERAATVIALDERVIETGEVIVEEGVSALRVRADGEPTVFRMIKFPVRDAGGRVTGVGTAMMDITAEKRAQKAMEEAQARLSSIIENLPIMVSLKDTDGIYRHANARFAEWHRVDLDRLIGLTSEDLVPKERAEAIKTLDQRVMETGEVHVVETESVLGHMHGGRPVVLQQIKFPVKGPDGRITGIGTAMFDITDQRRAEEALQAHLEKLEDMVAERTAELTQEIKERENAEADLRRSEANLRQVLEKSPVGVAIVARNPRRRLFVNPSFLAMFGARSQEELDAVPMIDTYVDPEDLVRATTEFDTTGTIKAREIRRRRLDGAVRWFLMDARTVEFEGAAAALVWHYDITARKEAEAALARQAENLERMVAERTRELKESESLLNSVFDNLPVALLIKDVDHRVAGVNATFLNWYGQAKEQIVGTNPENIEGFLPEGERERMLAQEDEVFRHGVTLSRQIERPFVDGKVRTLSVTKFPIFDQEGAVTRIGSISVDLTEQVEARKELEAKERLLDSVIENLPVGLVIKDRSGRHERVNKTFCQWHGVTPGDVLGRTSGEALGASLPDQEDVTAQEAEVIATGRSLTRSSQRVFADGMMHHLIINKYPVSDADGKVTGLVSVSVDLTEQVEARRALQERQAWLKAFTDNVPMLLNLKDLEGHYKFMNQRYAQAFGITEESALGKTVFDILPRDRAEMLAAMDKRVLETGEPQETEAASVLDQNGQDKVLQFLKFPVRDDVGTVTGLGTAVLDITDRRRADLALKESESRFRGLFEHAPAGITITTVDGRYLAMNRTFLDWKGWDLLDVVGRRAPDLFGPEVGGRAEAENARVMATKTVFTKDVSIQCADGRTIKTTNLKAPMLAPDGQVTGVCSFYVDVTDLREVEAQLQQAQKMEAVGRLAGGIAHDFNNLLGAIMGFNEFLIEDLEEGTPQHSFAQRIAKAGERAKQLISQILAFSRASHGEQTIVDINAIAEEAATLLTGTMPVSTRIIFTPSATPVTAMSNAGQMSQIMMNLAVNANDAFAGRDGVIRVTVGRVEAGAPELKALENQHGVPARDFWDIKARDDGGWQLISGALDPQRAYVMVSVEDNGPGIPEGVLRRIFDPFFTTKDPGKGTGLGLAVVHGIIAAHKGAIRVLTCLGEGTRFEIYLPAAKERSTRAEAPDAAAPVVGRGMVLIVDDERDVADMVAIGLERLGYEVGVCANAREALEALSEDPGLWRAVISDQMMPEVRGMDLIRAIKKDYPDLPCILCTGFGDSLTEEKALADGADAFFQKPVSAGRLAQSLAQLLGQ